MVDLIAQAFAREFCKSSLSPWREARRRPSNSGVVLRIDAALGVFSARATRRFWAAGFMILAALRGISQAIGGGKSGDAKQHRRSD
jgi:hypothetical protein